MLGKAARIVNNLQLVNAPFGILAVKYEGCIKNSKNVFEKSLTGQGHQDYEPSSQVREGVDDLILLPFLILGTTLIVADSFKSGDAFIFSKHASMYRRIR